MDHSDNDQRSSARRWPGFNDLCHALLESSNFDLDITAREQMRLMGS